MTQPARAQRGLLAALAALGALGALGGCGAPAPPRPPAPSAAQPPTPPAPPAAPPTPRPRVELDAEGSPTSLALAGGTLLWTDVAGGIWAMPADGSGRARQLSDQKRPGFAFQLFTAGGEVLATSRGDLLRVGVPDGPVTLAKIRGLPEYPIAAAADDEFIYLTLFKRPEIMRVPIGGGAAQKLAELPRAILALRGGTLYAASYTTGTLVAITTATGASRVVARGLAKPTAMAADDRHVFMYCEQNRTLLRVNPATGAIAELARGLINSDDLALDGDYVYTRTWGPRPALVRIAKDGSRPQRTLAELPSPSGIAIDAGAIYAASRDGNRIIRLAKAALGGE